MVTVLYTSMLLRASTDSWWTPADALYLLPVTTALWLCSDLHQHLLPGYNTGSTYTFCSYIHTVLPLRTTLNSFLFFFSSDFPAGLFCIVTYLIPSFSGLVGEKQRTRDREAACSIFSGAKEPDTFTGFGLSASSLDLWILFSLIVWLNMHLGLLVTPL